MKKILMELISFYQKAVSPWLGSHCRFYPSCSEWGKQALEHYGILKGLILLTGRLLSCHPFHPGGYQPLKKDG